jgi:tetratricopeptide (TPR) repeat protein
MMKKQPIIASAAAVILALMLFAPLTAQEGAGTGRLIGYVFDTDNKPIEGVQLTLDYVKYNRTLEKVTDNYGKFTFLGLGKGYVRLRAEKKGYVDEVHQFEVYGINRNPRKKIVMKRVEDVDPGVKKTRASKDNFSQGLALFEARKFKEALASFEKFREMQPKLHKVAFNIANCYIEMQQYDEAIKELEKVLEVIKSEKPDLKGNSEVAKIYSTIGDVYMRQNNFNEAEKFFKKAIDIDPADHAVAYNVAEIMFVAGKTDEAIKYYEMAININPEWAKSYKQLGYAYLNKGDTKKAVEMFNKFLKLDPNSPEAPGIKEVIKSL